MKPSSSTPFLLVGLLLAAFLVAVPAAADRRDRRVPPLTEDDLEALLIGARLVEADAESMAGELEQAGQGEWAMLLRIAHTLHWPCK